MKRINPTTPALKAVLVEVNKMRKLIGRGPRVTLACGVRRQGASCPITNSVGWESTSIGIGFYITRRGHSKNVLLHQDVSTFIYSFDVGKYPELEL